MSKTELRALRKAEKVDKMLYFIFTKQVLTRVTALWPEQGEKPGQTPRGYTKNFWVSTLRSFHFLYFLCFSSDFDVLGLFLGVFKGEESISGKKMASLYEKNSQNKPSKFKKDEIWVLSQNAQFLSNFDVFGLFLGVFKGAETISDLKPF